MRIALIEEALRASIPPAEPGEAGLRRAAVAIVLREREGLVEVLLIRRAERAGDPWSGHAAFPGGRMDAGDASVEATAIREAREEVGLDLAPPAARLLGRLPDFTPIRRSRGLHVTPVLFEVRGDPPLALDPAEVAAAVWVPLASLGAHGGLYLYWWRPFGVLPLPIPLVLSCWRVGELTIWGLTYRMLTEVLRIAGDRRA